MLRYFAQLPPSSERVAALQLLGRLGAVAAGSWPFAVMPGAHPHASLHGLERAHIGSSGPTAEPGSSGPPVAPGVAEACAKCGGYHGIDHRSGVSHPCPIEPAPGVAKALELVRRPMSPPERAWMLLEAARAWRSDLDGLPCVECGEPAEWVEFGAGEALGLCQDHIGNHVP
jgi:hypothetical protein